MTAQVSIPNRRAPLWWWIAALLALAIASYSLRYVIIGERAFVPELAESFRTGSPEVSPLPLLRPNGTPPRVHLSRCRWFDRFTRPRYDEPRVTGHRG